MTYTQLLKIPFLAALLSLPLSAAHISASADTGTQPLPPLTGEAAAIAGILAGENLPHLKLNPASYTDETLIVGGQTVAFRAYRDIPYAVRPRDRERERMSIFIPAAYLSGGTVNGYTAKTVPIFLPNGVGGYMPGEILAPALDGTKANASLVALSRGLVVAAPAIRGRTDTDAAGVYVGKAPACIVDYKAAVRFLRYNATLLPAGNTERIIASGTSAGGALSALLGASGNSRDYDEELAGIAAAPGRDDIYAANCYCPITDLEHADMAYEWIFAGVMESPAATPMTADAIAASARLKELFPSYLNSLILKDAVGTPMQVWTDGSGSFTEYIKAIYRASAQSAVDGKMPLDGADWFTVKDGKVTDIDLAKYAVWATRLKAAPAFDRFDRSSGENDVFGTEDNTPRHFTDFSRQYDTMHGDLAPDTDIRRMNPMNYIGTAGVRTAPHFRIRHGAKDRDTSVAVPAILALRLQNAGVAVDFSAPWGQGHGGDYDLKELFDWIDRICK